MLKLNSKVKIKANDVEGRIVNRTDYINGSTRYTVQYMSLADKELHNIAQHDIDLEVIDDSETIEDPAADESLTLGTYVETLPYGEFNGIVTGISYSSSGCVEYEVSGYVPARGPVRHILDGEILSVVEEEEPVPVGAAGGSYNERTIIGR